MQRVSTVVLAVLAVVVFSAAGYVIVHNDTPDAASTPTVTSQPAASTTDTASTSATHSPTTPSTSPGRAAPPVIAFVGDDWTSGVGARPAQARFTTLVARRLSVQERNFGVAGTGYARATTSGGDYLSRVAAVAAVHPDVVVVTGGRNDETDFIATAVTRAHKLFAALHARLPNARLIAVAPFWGDSALPPEMTQLASGVRAGVTAVGGTYLALTDPLRGRPADMRDGADPNNTGYAAIAAALAPRLRGALR